QVTPGQASDTKQLVALLDQLAVARPGGIGRPRKRPDSLTADKAYSSKANRAALPQDCRGDPRAQRPESQPGKERIFRRTTAGLRREPLPLTQPGRTRLQ